MSNHKKLSVSSKHKPFSLWAFQTSLLVALGGVALTAFRWDWLIEHDQLWFMIFVSGTVTLYSFFWFIRWYEHDR